VGIARRRTSETPNDGLPRTIVDHVSAGTTAPQLRFGITPPRRMGRVGGAGGGFFAFRRAIAAMGTAGTFLDEIIRFEDSSSSMAGGRLQR